MPATTIIGIAGMVFILLAFFLEEFAAHTRRESVQYNVLNLVGAAMLAWYAWRLDSVPFLVLNVVWSVTATYKLVRLTA